MIDLTTEIKYHRQQVAILKTEKDTAGAVADMNILQAKHGVLNQQYKIQGEIHRSHRQQETENMKAKGLLTTIQNETNTQNTRLLQLQRRIYELEGRVGLPQAKFN